MGLSCLVFLAWRWGGFCLVDLTATELFKPLPRVQACAVHQEAPAFLFKMWSQNAWGSNLTLSLVSCFTVYGSLPLL